MSFLAYKLTVPDSSTMQQLATTDAPLFNTQSPTLWDLILSLPTWQGGW